MSRPEAVSLRVGDAAVSGDVWEADGAAKACVVLVHGFNSSRGEFGQLPARLAAAGYAVLWFDQRGYGKSEGEPGRTSVDAAVADIQAASAELRRRHPKLPQAVIGHSLGGAYAIAALARTSDFVAGIAAHPLNSLFEELKWFEKLGYHVIGKRAERKMAAGKPPGTIPYKLSYEKLFVSKEAAKKARAEGFLLGRVSLGNYRPALTMSATAWAREVKQPVLVIGSDHDRAVKHSHTRAVYDALAGPKEWAEHAGGHSLWRDVDEDKVAALCIAWLDKTVGGGR